MDYYAKPKLQAMRCPTCGGMLDGENGKDAIQCVYCGNTVVPVAAQNDDKPNSEMTGGVIRVEGMRSSSSALAYTELFFEEYDWNAFLYAPLFSVDEIDEIAKSMKVSSADDKSTWILHFKSVSVPYMNKIKGCAELLNKIVEKYKKGSDDAYSAFDAYRRVASGISTRRAKTLRHLGDYLAKAEKYGATAEEISELKAEVSAIEKMHAFPLYEDIKEIPEISKHIAECDARIAAKLAERGINAEAEYANAKQYLATGRFVEALSTLEKIEGYADSEELIDKAGKYFVLSDVLEIGGRFYFFRKGSENSLSLCTFENGVASHKDIIRNISSVVTNYADILYYIDVNQALVRYDFRTGTSSVIVNRDVNKDVVIYGDKIYLLSGYIPEYNDGYTPEIKLIEVEISSGNSRTIFEKLTQKPYFVGGKLVCTVLVEGKRTDIVVIDLDSEHYISFENDMITLEGVYKDTLIYTRNTPNNYNKALFTRKFVENAPEILVEENIYEYVAVVKDKIYYNIGGEGNRSLIIANLDGSNRTERTLYATKILFSDDEWVYYTRTLRSNSVLCRAHTNGTGEKIIARDVQEFHDITNGYLHYTDKYDELIRVRMDGSNREVLCDSIGEVLAISENRIVFSSRDAEYRNVSTDEGTNNRRVYVKSIYAVDFEGGGKRKLVYDVNSARQYDDKTIYYTIQLQGNGETQGLRLVMYALDIVSGRSRQLVTFDTVARSGCYVATAVYGSYDCPEVWTLRRFRDIKLAANWYGRAFIKMYYAISPTLVKWFGDCGWFKKLWKGRLDKMVEKLREEGFESTPYNDK